MSKDQKKTINIPVETVDNWSKTISYIVTTLSFLKLDKEWPTNIYCDGLNEIAGEMYELSKHNL